MKKHMKFKANNVHYFPLGQLFSQRLKLDWFDAVLPVNSMIDGFQSLYYPLGASVVFT